MPAHKLKPTLLANTSPPAWLSTEARLAIRAFARAHDHHQVEQLEQMVGEAAVEFHGLHSHDEWFRSQPLHTFTALEVAGESTHHPLDLLVMVCTPEPVGVGAMLCIYTTAEKPLGEDYHIARVIHESTTVTA